jgi:rubrerythrin
MASLKGTQTEKNLLLGFAGEAQARNRYTFFASKAKKEGFEQISAAFSETADQEKEHASRMFKLLEGGDVEISSAFPAGVIGTTSENLAAAAKGEDHEWQELYPGFADTAEKEGFGEIATMFRNISVAEKQHSTRFKDFKANIDSGKVFKKDKKIWWRCRNCGYIMEAIEAPQKCPACLHPQAYFEVLGENW